MKLKLWSKLWSNAPLRYLLIADGMILGSLAIWLGAGYKRVARPVTSLQQGLGEFAQQFPVRSANASALQLEELRAKLGLSALMTDPRIPQRFPPDPRQEQAYTALQKSITDHLNTQITQPADQIAPPPVAIRRYLAAHQADLAAIQTHLLTQPKPQWELYDIQQAGFNTPLPSFLGMLRLHEVLLLNALEQHRLGRAEAAVTGLAASVQLHQIQSDRPELITQLMATIIARYQAGVLRKLDRLPPNWPPQLAAGEAQVAFVNSLKMETFMHVKTLRDYPTQKWTYIGGVEIRPFPLAKILQYVQQPYFTFWAAQRWQQARQTYQTLPPQNICTFLEKLPDNTWSSQWARLGKQELNWELSQKVVQVKSLARKTHQMPTVVTGLAASSVCPDRRWTYQTTPNGTVSITLANPPHWLKPQDNDLPLTAQFSLKDQLKFPIAGKKSRNFSSKPK